MPIGKAIQYIYAMCVHAIHIIMYHMYTHTHTHTHTSLVKPDGSIVLRTSTYKVILSLAILKRLFHLMSTPPSHPTDEQPVINLCKTSNPPGQQTILVLTCCITNHVFRTPRTSCSSAGGGEGVWTSNGIAQWSPHLDV